MKIFMATLVTETNTFSPTPTGMAAFTTGPDWHRRDASRQPPAIANIPVIAWRRLGEADGHEIVESLCTFAQPAGATLQHVYEHLRDILLDDLRAALPVDVVLLFMHGAMVAHGYDDCEGDTLARVREAVDPACTIGIELDLHCHLTELMRASADAIITFKEYPHTDAGDRAPELYRICTDAAAGRVRPVMALHDCRMIATYRPTVPPVRGFVDRMKPPFEGGWNIFHTTAVSSEFASPASHLALRGNGRAAWPGWPTDPEMEALRTRWFATPDPAAERAVAAETERRAFDQVPYVSLGQIQQPTLFRTAVRDIVPANAPFFWGLRKV